MKRLAGLTKKSSHQILDYLYKDELLNVSMIHSIESRKTQDTELYVNYSADKVQGILHVANDGLANLTNFYARSTEGLKLIAHQIKRLNSDNMVVAGREDEVRYIQECLDVGKSCFLNNYYRMNMSKYRASFDYEGYELVKAKQRAWDVDSIIGFCPSDEQTVRENIRKGVYFLEYFGNRIGMARFRSWSRNFIEIASICVDEPHYGKDNLEVLLRLMVNEAHRLEKTPILQISHVNISAKKIYEIIGFEKVCDYSFQLVNSF